MSIMDEYTFYGSIRCAEHEYEALLLVEPLFGLVRIYK
jgi:hypothetical protein